MPFTSVEMSHASGLADGATVQVKPSGEEVIVYPVIAEPPLLAGAVTVIVAEAGVLDDALIPGAPGIVFGIAATDAVDASEVNSAFSATTVNVYSVPFVKPFISQASGLGNGATNSHDPPAGDEVIVYLVGAASALFAGAANETVAAPFEAVAITLLGASGFASGFTAVDAADEVVVPVAFVAVVVKVYELLLESGEIVQLSAGA